MNKSDKRKEIIGINTIEQLKELEEMIRFDDLIKKIEN